MVVCILYIKFTPKNYLKEIAILKYLSSKRIISVHHSSHLKSFDGNLIEGNYTEAYYINKVNYTLNMNYVSELTNPNIEITEENIVELYDCKHSEISMLFFNRIIDFGDKYREEVYTYENF